MHLPFGKSFLITGSSKDISIIRQIELTFNKYEPNITNLLKQIIDKDYLCLDVGANIGTISLTLAYLAPSGKVYAFEPSAKNIPFLVKNIEQNQINNIQPIKFALYDQNKQEKFTYIDEGGGWSFLDTGYRKGNYKEIIPYVPSFNWNHEIVSCVRLDDWVNIKGLKKLDFIKIDVEGAEIKVLQGGLNTLKRFKPDLIIEVNKLTLETIFGETIENLYTIVKNLYPNIHFIHRNHGYTKITDFNQLQELMSKEDWFGNLYCTYSNKI